MTPATSSPQALYLELAPDPVFAVHHRPAPGARRAVGIVLCPPFGWEDTCAYRPLRAWAQRLAADGHDALRISLPGSGDSGGSPRDPERPAAWAAAVDGAARWLRADAGARRIVVIGIGPGGVPAWLAAASGAPVDDLVLWGTPARGRALLRQLRAFAKLERGQIYQAGGSPPPPGTPAQDEIEAGGFVMSAATVATLEATDLTAHPLPALPGRRVLLLERDGIAVDAALDAHARAQAQDVTVSPGDGYGDMTSHPQLATAPQATIDRVASWLAAATPAIERTAPAAERTEPGAEPTAPATAGPARVTAATSAVMASGAGAVRETPVTFPQPHGLLWGILTEPLDPPADRPPAVVLLNPGAGRRIGPNRMWVEAARRWALDGITTLRLDVVATGDSDGDDAPYRNDSALYTPVFVPQVLGVLDGLRARGIGPRFVLGGLCSGAYWALHAAIADPEVDAALLINPRILSWERGIGPARDLRAVLSPPYSLARIRRVATADRVRGLALWLLAAPLRWLRARGGRAPSDGGVEAVLDRMLASGTRVLLLFSDHEPVDAELARSGQDRRLRATDTVTFEHVPVRDHTVRPSWSQRETHAALDRALARERAHLAAAPAGRPGRRGSV